MKNKAVFALSLGALCFIVLLVLIVLLMGLAFSNDIRRMFGG